MYNYKLHFSGEIPAVASDVADHGATLERIGREVVDLLRREGFTVSIALLNGPAVTDLVEGSPKSVPAASTEDVTRNDRKIGPKAPPRDSR